MAAASTEPIDAPSGRMACVSTFGREVETTREAKGWGGGFGGIDFLVIKRTMKGTGNKKYSHKLCMNVNDIRYSDI